MSHKPKEQIHAPAHEDYPPPARSKNCLVTVILLQVNYVNNGNSPIGAKLHANVEGQDLESSRTLETGGTISFALWFRESRRGRCGTDVGVSFVIDVSASPRAEISPLEAHLAETRTYKCPSFADQETFRLTLGDPKSFFITFDFVFRVELECRDV
jgi:hypothetical protein